MQSQSPAASALSQIKLTFGDQIQGNCPLNINASLDYLSSKTQNKRFNAGEYLNTEIPIYSLLLQVQAKGDAEQLAQKLNHIRKTSASIKQLEEGKQLKMTIVGKGGKVYILVSHEELKVRLQQLEKSLKTQQLAPNEQKWVSVQVSSNNKFNRIRQLIEEKGALGAFLDSLSISIKFLKTENILELIKIMFDAVFGQAKAKSLVQSFEHFNFELQMESASVLENYPKFAQQMKGYKFNDDFKVIKQSLGNKLQAYVFGKPLSISASFSCEEMYLILDLLFA